MKYCVFLLSLILSTQAHAVTCFLTMVKGACWKAYDLTVDILDADTGKLKKTILVPADQLWTRREFECKPKNMIALAAKFSPAFWEGDADKVFKGQRYWKLPDMIKPGETGWNITVCYPQHFADVPRPPDINTNCECDLSSIPKIEPQKVP